MNIFPDETDAELVAKLGIFAQSERTSSRKQLLNSRSFNQYPAPELNNNKDLGRLQFPKSGQTTTL